MLLDCDGLACKYPTYGPSGLSDDFLQLEPLIPVVESPALSSRSLTPSGPVYVPVPAAPNNNWELNSAQPDSPESFRREGPAQSWLCPDRQVQQWQPAPRAGPLAQAGAQLQGLTTPTLAEIHRQDWYLPAQQPHCESQQPTRPQAPQQQQSPGQPPAASPAGCQQQEQEPALAAHHRRMALLLRYWQLSAQQRQQQHQQAPGAVPACGAPSSAALPARAIRSPLQAQLPSASRAVPPTPSAAAMPSGACFSQGSVEPLPGCHSQDPADLPPPTSPKAAPTQARASCLGVASLDPPFPASPPSSQVDRWGSSGFALPSSHGFQGAQAVGAAAGQLAKRARPSGAEQKQQAKRPREQRPRTGSKEHIVCLAKEIVELRNEITRLQNALHLWSSQGCVTPDQALEFLSSIHKQARPRC